MTLNRLCLLVMPLGLSLACSDKGSSAKALAVNGENIVQGGYTVRFEAKPPEALKKVNFLAEPIGTLCRHPTGDSSEGLNKIWLYGFTERDSKRQALPAQGYAVLERGGSLMVSAWSTQGQKLDKKGVWTLLRDAKARFGCDLPLGQPLPFP